jgi:hypothetical protein
MARKLACILWHLLEYRKPFPPEVFAGAGARCLRRFNAR